MSLLKGTQPSAKISRFHQGRGFLERVLDEQSANDDQSCASQVFPFCPRFERAPLILLLLLLVPHPSHAETVSRASEIALPAHLDEQRLSNNASEPQAEVDALRIRARALASEGDILGAADTLVNALYLIHREEGVTTKNQIPIVQQLQNLAVQEDDFRQADKLAHLQHFLGQRADKGDLPSNQTLLDWYFNTAQYRRAKALIADVKEDASPMDDELEQSIIVMEARLARFIGRCCGAEALLNLIRKDESSVDAQGSPSTSKVASSVTRQTVEALLLRSKKRDNDAIDQLTAQLSDSEPYFIPSLRRVTLPSDESIRSRMLEQQIRMRYARNQSMFEEDRELEESPLFFIVPIDGMLPVMIEDQTGLKTGPAFAADLVGEPIAFLKRKIKQDLPSRYQRDEKLADLSISMTMTVTARGRVTDLTFEQGTPGQVKRLFIDIMKRVRMMPKIEAGVAVASPFSFVQTFRGANRQGDEAMPSETVELGSLPAEHVNHVQPQATSND